jgi:G3E family GTPase
VEPSGVGKLSNVIANLQRIEYERLKLLRPITIIDGQAFTHDRQAYADIYQDPIRAAGVVLLSKPDHPSRELVEQVSALVAETNPEATLITSHYTRQDDEWFRGLLRQTYSGGIVPISSDGESGLETCHVDGCAGIDPAELMYLLQDALYGRYGEVVRAKGIVPTKAGWVRFDIAGGQTCVTGIGEGDADGERLEPTSVWIGRGLDRLGLARVLAPESLEARHECHHHGDGHDHGDGCCCHHEH